MTSRPRRAAAEAATSAISHIAKHGTLPPAPRSISPSPPRPPKKRKPAHPRITLNSLPFDIKSMIVDHIEQEKRFFDLRSLMLVSREWRAVIRGGSDSEAEIKWERRYRADWLKHGRNSVPPGCSTWEEGFYNWLGSVCYGCKRAADNYKAAYHRWPELKADFSWAQVCFDCSGDEADRTCSGCRFRTYAYECEELLCWHCCSGCYRHPKGEYRYGYF